MLNDDAVQPTREYFPTPTTSGSSTLNPVILNDVYKFSIENSSEWRTLPCYFMKINFPSGGFPLLETFRIKDC